METTALPTLPGERGDQHHSLSAKTHLHTALACASDKTRLEDEASPQTATPPAAAVPSTAANAAPLIAADWQNANHEPAGTAAPKTDDWMPAAMDPE